MSSVPPPPPPPGANFDGPALAGGYPVDVRFDRPLEVARWRPLVNWLLAIPHLLVVYALGIVSRVLWLISFFTILFTKRNPFLGFQTMVMRYQWRATSFALFMRDEYPPFDFSTRLDAGETPDAAEVTVRDPGEMSRGLIFVKWLLAIPHFIVIVALVIAAIFVWIVAFFAVLFTGKFPEGLRNFLIGVTRWTTRVTAYIMFLTDEYPPFRLDP